MNLVKVFSLITFFSTPLAQVGLAQYVDGLIQIKNDSRYVVQNIRCWDSSGRRTHSSSSLGRGQQRYCDNSEYLKIQGVAFYDNNYERRFYRLDLDCSEPSKVLCVRIKSGSSGPRFEARCRLRYNPRACR